MMNKEEKWIYAKGFEGIYMVSTHGRVKSLKRERVPEDRMLNPSPNNKGYLTLTLYKNSKPHRFLLHRLIAENFIAYKEGMVVDHIDRDKLNNNVSNLRFVSQRENTSYIRGNSKYTGVYLPTGRDKWRAAITVDGKKQHIGNYDTQEEAHKAYQEKLISLHKKQD